LEALILAAFRARHYAPCRVTIAANGREATVYLESGKRVTRETLHKWFRDCDGFQVAGYGYLEGAGEWTVRVRIISDKIEQET
jgi:hypothetical protein